MTETKEQRRQRKLVEKLFDDAREMAGESKVDPCSFCQLTAMTALLEIAANGHDVCILRFMSEFNQHWTRLIMLRGHDDEDEG
jgi:hypothetical protein